MTMVHNVILDHDTVCAHCSQVYHSLMDLLNIQLIHLFHLVVVVVVVV